MSMEAVPSSYGDRVIRHTPLCSPHAGKRNNFVGLYKCKECGEFKSPEYKPHCPKCGRGGCTRVKRGKAVD